MQLQTRTINAVTVLDLAGRFDNYTAPAVADWLEQAAGSGTPRLVVNLAEVSFVDSTGLASLVRGLKRCRQRNGELYLCGLQPPVYMIFELARLDRAFTIFADAEHAISVVTGGGR